MGLQNLSLLGASLTGIFENGGESMTDIEKVIKGLECAIGTRGIKTCDDCPYDNDFNCIGCDIVMRDALALLKEQEPRMLMLEELKQSVCPCWFESRNTYMGQEGFWIIPDFFTERLMHYVFSIPSKHKNHTDYAYSDLGQASYNRTWRCWTSKPTDEQRKAVKWE